MMMRLAGLTTRRPWRVVMVTVAFFLIALIGGGVLTGGLAPGGFEDPDSEFVAARETLMSAADEAPAPGLLVVVDTAGPVTGAEGRAKVERIAATIEADPKISRVLTAFNGGGEDLISGDGTATYLAGYFTTISENEVAPVAERVTESLAGEEGVTIGGAAAVAFQINDVITADLLRAELIAFPIIFLLSLWVFRGLVAALLPSMMGALVIFGGFLALGLLNLVTDISIYALNLVIGLGLGLAIDYSLLVVSRYREELAAHGPGRMAIARTLQTAGRSVVFSAVTVAASLAGLMIFPQPFLFSMGLGGVMVALIACVAAVVVLPAVLALLGPRVNALAPRRWRAHSELANLRQERGFWVVLSRAIMRRPAPVAALTAVALIVVALPALGITFTTVDSRSLPDSVDARVVSDRLADEFPQALLDPVFIAVSAPTSPEAADQVGAYAQELAGLPEVEFVAPPTPVGDSAWRVDLYTQLDAFSADGQQLVRDVRAVAAPFPADVSGLGASFVDQKDSIAAHLPWAILIISLATIIALFLMTGSLILPLKAVVMNLLTLAATLGLLVWIFQDGRFESLLRYDGVGALDLTSPILLGAMAFGLATDYTVFLLARIKEAHDAGEPTNDAVAFGLQRTGRIVTAAALLFAVAIGAFVTSEILLIKQLGFGTAAAVLIDATIIRALLVPSLMGLFGRWNWWAPGPLRRLHARIGFSESGPAPRTGVP